MTIKTKSGLAFEFVKTNDKKILRVDSMLA